MKLRKIVDKVLEAFLVFIMAVLVLDVLWQVASRYLMKEPSAFTDELAGFLLIWVGLFGAAYATGKKAHLAIELLPQKINPDKRKYLDALINLLIAAFAVIVLIIGGVRLVYITLKLNQLSSALQVPLGYIYLVVPVSGLLIFFYALSDIVYWDKLYKEKKQVEQ